MQAVSGRLSPSTIASTKPLAGPRCGDFAIGSGFFVNHAGMMEAGPRHPCRTCPPLRHEPLTDTH